MEEAGSCLFCRRGFAAVHCCSDLDILCFVACVFFFWQGRRTGNVLKKRECGWGMVFLFMIEWSLMEIIL